LSDNPQNEHGAKVLLPAWNERIQNGAQHRANWTIDPAPVPWKPFYLDSEHGPTSKAFLALSYRELELEVDAADKLDLKDNLTPPFLLRRGFNGHLHARSPSNPRWYLSAPAINHPFNTERSLYQRSQILSQDIDRHIDCKLTVFEAGQAKQF
jgi:hypothetical protein